VETMFDTTWQEGIRFKGRIDRLDCLSDNQWLIIDYKKSGKEQENALINQFLKYDDNFQFPIYYFAVKEAHKLEIAGFQQLVFDFKNQREFKSITIPIRQEVSDKKRKKWVTPDELETIRKRIVEITEELLSLKSDFTKTVKTQCRPYGGFKCPYLAFCTKSEDVEDADNSGTSE
jgi:ATP-dependent helicase/DNAse subunit B